MASKSSDVRPKITLACTECKERNYITKKNRRNDPDRIELAKFCPNCGKHTPHFGNIAFYATDSNKFRMRHLGDHARREPLPHARIVVLEPGGRGDQTSPVPAAVPSLAQRAEPEMPSEVPKKTRPR